MNNSFVDTLSALDVFLSVAERLSFADAGRRLGVSPSAIGKSIGRLETYLGASLFLRTTRRVSLTAEGELLLERAKRVRDEVEEIAALFAEAAAEPRGRLRVTLPAIGYRFLAPHLRNFVRAFPRVHLDLDFSDGIVDLAARGVDVAIRSGVLPDSGLMSRKLGRFRFLVCAAPSYIATRGEPRTAKALADHALIRFRPSSEDALQAWQLLTGPPSERTLGPAALTCTNMEAVLAASIAGLGLACLPDFLAFDAIGRGELVPVLPEEASEGSFSLVWVGGRQVSPRVRAFIDFASEHLLVAREHETLP